MTNIQKCWTGTEADCDALVAIIQKALAYPLVGTPIGAGSNATIPPTWNGLGITPTGWTRQRVANWVVSAATARVPISDALATELNLPANQARLTAGEQSTLATALAARANVTLSSGGHVPKTTPILYDEARVVIVLLTGQSLNLSDAEGGSGPFPVGRHWDLQWASSTAFADISATTRSKDVAIAQGLRDLGRNSIIINLALGGTSSADWTPPSGASWVTAAASFDAALALLTAEIAGRTPLWIHFHDQGEKNVSDAGGEAAALQWAENAALLFAEIETMAGTTMNHVIGLTKDPQPVNHWIDIIRAEQTAAAASAAHLINRDALPYKVDEIHLTHPAGERAYGALQVAKITEFAP